MSSKYLGEVATVFPLSLALEEEGFELDGLEMGDATGEEGLAGDFSVVATDRSLLVWTETPLVTLAVASLGHWVAWLPRTNLVRPWSA